MDSSTKKAAIEFFRSVEDTHTRIFYLGDKAFHPSEIAREIENETADGIALYEIYERQGYIAPEIRPPAPKF